MKKTENKNPNWRKGEITKINREVLGLTKKIHELQKKSHELKNEIVRTTEEVYKNKFHSGMYIVVHYDQYGHQAIKYVNTNHASKGTFQRVPKRYLMNLLNTNYELAKGGLPLMNYHYIKY